MSNPYEPPKTPLEASQPKSGFRWRLIPSAFLILFGTLLVVATIFSIVMDVIRGSDIMSGYGFSWTLGRLVMGTAGGLWVGSGTLFWKRRWWVALFCLLIGFALGVIADTYKW